MAGTEVLTSKLKEVASSLNDLTMRYNQSVDKMYDLGTELDGMWDGDSNDAFNAQFRNDRERFNAMTKLLQAYQDALIQQADIYDKAEADALQAIATNKIR